VAASSKVQLGGMLCDRGKDLCSYETLAAQGFFFLVALPISYKEKKHMCRFFWPILLGNLAIGCILDRNFNDSSSCMVLHSKLTGHFLLFAEVLREEFEM
jgi:hypothetical protein